MSQTVSSGSKPCVYCGEQIRRDAKKCRYCGEWFDDSGPTSPQALPDLFDHPRLPLRNLESPSHSSAAPPTSVAPHPTTTGAAPAAQGKPPVNGFAVASLVLALVGLGVGSILALIFGYKAKDSIDKSDGGQSGRGIAIAGIVLGWIQVAALVVIGIIIAISASIPTPDERAKSALETFASAEFSYHADHGTFTDDASVLIDEYGATKLSPFDTWFIPYATEDAFCLWGKFHLDGNEQGGTRGAAWSTEASTFYTVLAPYRCGGFPQTPWD